MMCDGILEKPSLDELYHEKTHKYVERYKNAKGKWVYKYTNPENKKSYNSKYARLTKKLVKLELKGIDKLRETKKKQKHYAGYGKINTKNGRG